MKQIIYTFNGVSDNIKNWSKRLNMCCSSLHRRLNSGYSFEEAISTRFVKFRKHEDDPKICSICEKEKPITCFYRFKRRTGKETGSYCNDCSNKRSKEFRFKFRLEILTHYSKGKPKCSLCGIDDVSILDLDHINGGGSKERRNSGNRVLIVFV